MTEMQTISDTLNPCPAVISQSLKEIREKQWQGVDPVRMGIYPGILGRHLKYDSSTVMNDGDRPHLRRWGRGCKRSPLAGKWGNGEERKNPLKGCRI